MDDKIRDILFDMVQHLKFHKIAEDNMILEVDYEKYVEKLKSILGEYNDTP